MFQNHAASRPCSGRLSHDALSFSPHLHPIHCQRVAQESDFTIIYCRKIRLDFLSCSGLFDDFDEFPRVVGHGDERLESSRDLLGIELGFAEFMSQGVDLDLGEDFFESGVFAEEYLHVGWVLEVLDQRGLSQHGAQHAA